MTGVAESGRNDECVDAQSSAEQWSNLAGWDVPQSTPPHLISLPAAQVHENLVGRRARFRLTSYDEQGHLLHEGWRDGLRVLSARPSLRDGIDEPALMILEESTWYRYLEDGDASEAVWVGESRLFVDVWSPSSSAALTHSRLESALNVRGLPGRRGVALMDDGQYEADLRIVMKPHTTQPGDLVAIVASERDWFKWRDHDYGRRHPTLRAVRACRLWVEV